MKPKDTPSFIIIWVFGIFLSSCMTYQYVTIEGSVPKSDSNELVIENDSLRIRYLFHGENCPATVQILNKMDVPLYVDWHRSAFIIGEKTIAQWSNKSSLNATSVGSVTRWSKNQSISVENVTGEITPDKNLNFIPPRASVEAVPVVLQSDFFELKSRKPARYETSLKGVVYVLKAAKFDSDDTPLTFRNYLTLSLDPSFEKPIVYDHTFWVSQVTEGSISPGSFNQIAEPGLNRFYIRKSTGGGAVLAAVSVAALFAASDSK